MPPDLRSAAAAMSRRRLRAIACLALVAGLGGTLSACGGDSDADASKAAASATCPASISVVAKTQPPTGLPLPSGAGTAYSVLTQGKTQYFSFALTGTPATLANLRDAYDNVLVGAGYKITETDQESGAEAESAFTGPHDGSTRWRNLCTGKAVLLLGVSS